MSQFQFGNFENRGRGSLFFPHTVGEDKHFYIEGGGRDQYSYIEWERTFLHLGDGDKHLYTKGDKQFSCRQWGVGLGDISFSLHQKFIYQVFF